MESRPLLRAHVKLFPYCPSGSDCPIIVRFRPFACGIPIALFFYRVDPKEA
jgi:hypothetical protein